MEFRHEGMRVVLGHADHGVTENQLRWCLDSLLSERHRGFVRRAWTLPEELRGDLRSALWGPSVGDEPIPDTECRWIVRGNRRCATRTVARPTRSATDIVLIGKVGESTVALWTAYGSQRGVIAPREPGDLSISLWRDLVEAREFWEVHALADEDWARRRGLLDEIAGLGEEIGA